MVANFFIKVCFSQEEHPLMGDFKYRFVLLHYDDSIQQHRK